MARLEQVKLRLPAELNASVESLAGGRTSKSAWIEEAIRRRVEHESAEMAPLADLPPAARERIAEYIELVRAAVRDEELSELEQAWEREKDPDYYGLHMGVPSTMDACIDSMVGRGACRRVSAAARCV